MRRATELAAMATVGAVGPADTHGQADWLEPEPGPELESEPEPEPMPRPELDSASMPSLEPTPEQDAQVLFISGGGGDEDASTLKFSSTNLGASC